MVDGSGPRQLDVAVAIYGAFPSIGPFGFGNLQRCRALSPDASIRQEPCCQDDMICAAVATQAVFTITQSEIGHWKDTAWHLFNK
jgi:hypothetical protein